MTGTVCLPSPFCLSLWKHLRLTWQELVIMLRKQPSSCCGADPHNLPRSCACGEESIIAAQQRTAPANTTWKHLAELSPAPWDTADAAPRVWSCFGSAELWLWAWLKNRKGGDCASWVSLSTSICHPPKPSRPQDLRAVTMCGGRCLEGAEVA